MPKIIPTMVELGYSPNKKGVCFGIASMAAQAVIREAPRVFFDRVVRIHNLTEENIKSITSNREHGKIDDLYYFFDGVAIYHGPSALSLEFSKLIPHRKQSIENKIIFQNVSRSTENTELYKPSDIKAMLICSVSVQELESFVLEVKSHFGERAFSLMIHYLSPAHSVQLGCSNNQWLIVDHDDVQIYQHGEISIESITDKILLNKRVKEKKEVLNFSVDILACEQIKIDLQHLTQKYELNDEKIIALKQDKRALVDLIQCCAYSNKDKILRKIFKYIDLPLVFDEYLKNDVPALYVAAQDGQIGVVNALLELIQNTPLAAEQKALLLAAKTVRSVPALYIAAQNGYADIVRAFIQAIETSQLTQEQRLPLFAGQIENGTSALYIAAQNGYVEVVKVLIQAIEQSSFTFKEKRLLLEAKNLKGNPALSMAIQEGHVEIVEALIDAFSRAKLTPEQKISILEAKNQNDALALYMAVKNSHVNIIELLIRKIGHSKLTVEQRMSLLEARDRDGLPMLFRLVQENCVELIRVFIQCFEDLQLPVKQHMFLLESRSEKGISAFFSAAQCKRIDVLMALVNAVDNLDIAEMQKVRFIFRGTKNNDSILRRAAMCGNVEVFKYLVEYIFSSKIPVEEKVRLLVAKRTRKDISVYAQLFSIRHLAIYTHIVQHLETSVVNSSIFSPEQKIKILR